MQTCPICGETLPLSGRECWHCGHEVDEMFLTEEAKSSSVAREASKLPANRKQPGALKPSRFGPVERRRFYYIGGALAVLLVVAVILVVVLPKGAGAARKPEEAVSLYYQALQKGNADNLLAVFEPGFQPRAGQRTNVEAALGTNKYVVTGPRVHVISNDGTTALVAIDSVVVDITTAAGTQKKSLVDSVQDPSTAQVVKVTSYGGGWQISGRPTGGWAPENLWLIGNQTKV
jgi:hypothetical protein